MSACTKFIPYLLIVVLMSMILGCGGSDDLASESSTELAATAAPTGIDTSMPKATSTPEQQATSTPEQQATSTPEQPVAQTIELVTVKDEFKMFSIKVPKSWETTTMVDDLDQDMYTSLYEVGSLLIITSVDPETGSNILIYVDLASTFADEPQPIDLEIYIKGTLQVLGENPNVDRSSFERDDITVNGMAGAQIRYLLSGLPISNNLFVGSADDPELLCGSIVAIAQGIAAEPQQQTTIDKILNSLKALPTFKGDIRSCADRSQLSSLEQKVGQLELIEWNIEIGEYDIMSVVGIVENNTASDFDFVSITFGTYDAAGFKLGEAIDNQALRAGEKWKFEAMIFDENVDTVKVIALEGF